MADPLRVMSRRRFSLWQKVTALAPLLLLAVYLPGQVMLRCRIDGTLRPACCCPDEDQAESRGPVARAQDCCDRVVGDSERPAVDAPRAAERDVARALAVAAVPVAVALPAPPSTRPDRARQWRSAPPGGPPAVLLKHAFLI
jgi:hypothetical protein